MDTRAFGVHAMLAFPVPVAPMIASAQGLRPCHTCRSNVEMLCRISGQHANPDWILTKYNMPASQIHDLSQTRDTRDIGWARWTRKPPPPGNTCGHAGSKTMASTE